MKNPLIDHKFLKELDAQRLRITYAKLISLNLQEEPIEEIIGRVISGTINVDGNSAVRRTCNLSLRTDKNISITDYYWTLKTKFKVYVGIQNNINPEYPDIVWFPMGIFVINQFTCSHTTNSLTININGKDKMSLLNGDMGGLFTGSIDLGTKEEIQARYEPGQPDENLTPKDEGLYCDTLTHIYYKWDETRGWVEASPTDYVYVKKTIPIKDILFYMLRTFGGEEIQNLIISDLDEEGVELLTYRADDPLYYYYSNDEAQAPNYQGNAKVFIDIPINENYYAYLNKQDIFESWTFLTADENKSLLWIRELFVDDATLWEKRIRWRIKLEDLQEHGVYKMYFNEEEKTKYLLCSFNGNSYAINSDGERITIDQSGYEPGGETIFHFLQLNKEVDTKATICYTSNDTTNTNDAGFNIYRIVKGDAAGFRSTVLTYPGDLIANAGESIVSILDKITKALAGDFEYFYDLQGRFVFQKKKTYLNVPYTPIKVKDQTMDKIEFVTDNTRLAYTFANTDFFVSVSNAPAIQNLKNDFVVWGQRKTLSGAEVPIHMRYAIHKKPVYYKNYWGDEYYTKEYEQAMDINIVDWREIIYQMAVDYQNNYMQHDFISALIRNNQMFYPTGRTGYEQFYEDMVGFWRDIYNPNPTPEEQLEHTFIQNEENKHFNIDVLIAPQNLNFWIDFLDAYSAIGQYSVLNIGDRQKVATDNTVKAIHYKEPPQVIFYNPNKQTEDENLQFLYTRDWKWFQGSDENVIVVQDEVEESVTPSNGLSDYQYFQLPTSLESLFTISSQGKSAKNQIDEWMYNFANVTEAATLTSVPIYYLDANTLINLSDQESHVEGEYIINRITYNLSSTGNMTLNASKVNRRLY